jgi:hypothetical protein
LVQQNAVEAIVLRGHPTSRSAKLPPGLEEPKAKKPKLMAKRAKTPAEAKRAKRRG